MEILSSDPTFDIGGGSVLGVGCAIALGMLQLQS
jgi:hypothetical protein